MSHSEAVERATANILASIGIDLRRLNSTQKDVAVAIIRFLSALKEQQHAEIFVPADAPERTTETELQAYALNMMTLQLITRRSLGDIKTKMGMPL